MNGPRWFPLVSLVAVFWCASWCAASEGPGGFISRTYENPQGNTLLYRLFVPTDLDPQARYPLVVFLHGAHGRGHDNRRQITGGNAPGTNLWTRPENQRDYPCLVLAPQCPPRTVWANRFSDRPTQMTQLVLELVEKVTADYNVDPDRVYVTGQSMGGFGTWDLIARRPDLFAAAVPLAAGGNVAKAALMADVPIWVFHGKVDRAVSVREAQRIISALKKVGGSPRYTEYRNGGHDIGARAYAEPGLLPWLFSQKRSTDPARFAP